MKTAQLREMTADELRGELIGLRKVQFRLRMERASEQLPQTHLITEARRDIARVKTLIREKLAQEELAQQPTPEKTGA